MGKKKIHSKYAQEAASLFGEQIKLGRKQRNWSERDLSERAGISRATLQKIENGEVSCAIGSYFEVAALVGFPLFESDESPLSMQLNQTRDKIALLPKRTQGKKREIRDDF